MDIKFRSDMGVALIHSAASDDMVIRAARVSTGKDEDAQYPAGLIRYLMRNRHGSPFEHGIFTFRIECPLFVAREFMRHRIASYNETSGRYVELEPVFWMPHPDRALVQSGKPGEYVMNAGSLSQAGIAASLVNQMAVQAYSAYQRMIYEGIAREVARAVLPLSLYTSFYVTINPRSLMNFLSLRVDEPEAAYPSKPQYEIHEVATIMESHFAARMPVTHRAFADLGRVAP